MPKEKMKERVKERKGISKGPILGIVGIVLSVIFFTPLGSFLVGGFLTIVICSAIGLGLSVKDRKNKKKGALFGIILNTIILLMWVLIVIWIFLAFVIFHGVHGDPFPRGDCFKAIDQIEIDTSSQYTCYYLENEHVILNVSVKRGSEPLQLQGFVITAFGEGKSEKFEISNVPERRKMTTYSLTTNLTELTSVEIAPVVEGNIFCDAADRKVIEKCG
ncbi:hypothetical protein A3K73_08495 [Candidatus Pacearchaeota archaeon RBG_13_36_9]|nr:MAG: hypothetical protein A3K73_08495 [Candidatus Pacearchaeota archaeon RBG_13_36_9]